MLIHECKLQFQFKKSSKNVKFGQCLYLVAHLCYEQNRCADNPPGNEVLYFSFFPFILDYKYQNNLFTLRRFAKQRAILDLSTFFDTPCATEVGTSEPACLE